MGEDPPSVEEPPQSLLRQPAETYDTNDGPLAPVETYDTIDGPLAPPERLATPPPPPPPPAEPVPKMQVAVEVSPLHEAEHETPEIAPPPPSPPPQPATDHSETLQNDASPMLPTCCTECSAIEFQATEADRSVRRDSGLASIDLEPSQTLDQPVVPIVLNDCGAYPTGSHAQATEEVAESDDMAGGGRIAAPSVTQTIKPIVFATDRKSIVADSRSIAADTRSLLADTRSIAAGSIGGRSLFAPSVISPEDEILSLRVRSLYDSGVGGMGSDASSQFSSDIAQRRISSIIEESAVGVSRIRGTRSSFPGANIDLARRSRMGGSAEDLRLPIELAEEGKPEASKRSSLAGGVEDWEDLEGYDVDRYGFINHTYVSSSAPTPPDAKAAPKRVATALFLQSQEPRKRPLTIKTLRLSPSAPEMLKSPLPEKTVVMRDKENTRSRKWKEMAMRRKKCDKGIPISRGAGVGWCFVTTDPKLINRTWKGIPDCWRGAAWHAFLSASAKTRKIGKPDAELVAIYNELLERGSSDDVQIDLDVPRTISSHIMFRRRYRGGQRLLFRVLHALALYFPDVGYVQGMASIAATLLCYYDEETAFVMMVRLWELRGLEKLYQSGFGGLMAALDEFESDWMKGNPVSKKLTSLGIGPTAYGTRWYLTLFNYSIPFAAQLRVWDVFMLLGDPDPGSKGYFDGTLDVLHATSVAILDGLKAIILRSDFEDAMKNMTSFIPVKDGDLLMKVVKGEWKMKRRKFGNPF